MPRRALKVLIPLAAVIVAVVVARAVVPGLDDLNPFDTETRERSQPTLLRSLESLSEYRAATANYQQVVEIERDVGILPSFLAGEKALLIAAGTVDAAVDFTGLGRGNVQVSQDRSAVTVTLPAPRLSPARLDLERSRAVKTERGLVNRVGDVLDDDLEEQRDLLLRAERRIERAARENPELLRLAERNTRAMLTGMLGGLGFERVTIRFLPPPAR